MTVFKAWEALFDLDFDTLLKNLRAYLERIRGGEIRPLSFGFGELVDGFTRIHFDEIKEQDGTIFIIEIIDILPNTRKERRFQEGAFIVYKGNTPSTLVSIQATKTYSDGIVKMAVQFANEMKGYEIPVEIFPLPVDRVREFIISGSLRDIIQVFDFVNHEHSSFGYSIEIPETKQLNKRNASFIILKNFGIHPPDLSRWRRHELGVIVCKQVGKSTSIKIYGPTIEERQHFWSYIGILKRRLQEFNLISENDPQRVTSISSDKEKKLTIFAEKLILGDEKMNNNISISNSTINGDLVVAKSIKDSFNKVTSADISSELKTTLIKLVEAVEHISKELPDEVKDEVADDLKKLVEEASKKSPNPKWYKVSIEGLIKAAENLGKVGNHVIKLASQVLTLLTQVKDN